MRKIPKRDVASLWNIAVEYTVDSLNREEKLTFEETIEKFTIRLEQIAERHIRKARK